MSNDSAKWTAVCSSNKREFAISLSVLMALSLVAATDKLAQIQGIPPQGAFDIMLIEKSFFYQRKVQKKYDKQIKKFPSKDRVFIEKKMTKYVIPQLIIV